MEAGVGVPLSGWQVKREQMKKTKKLKKNGAKQWEDQSELLAGLRHHSDFPFERREAKGLDVGRALRRAPERTSQSGGRAGKKVIVDV